MYANHEYCICKIALRSNTQICERCGKNRLPERLGLTKKPRSKNIEEDKEPVYQEISNENEGSRRISNLSELTDKILEVKNELEKDEQKVLIDKIVQNLKGKPGEGSKVVLNTGESLRAARSGSSSASST